MWNETDIPLAYLITFRCYGTWLHGDERGSIDRFHNLYQSSYISPTENWRQHNLQKLKGDPLILSDVQRKSVESAVRETCNLRGWFLRAINVRTNHIHLVVSIGEAKPALALNAFKANATRQMRQDGCWQSSHSPWADKGSKRYLWNERSVARAIDYVLNGQGNDLPDFNQD
ncbi:MAG: transposase [Acidobacteria bacterium]|nr:transposase [Acidobacteriota bacterium]